MLTASNVLIPSSLLCCGPAAAPAAAQQHSVSPSPPPSLLPSTSTTPCSLHISTCTIKRVIQQHLSLYHTNTLIQHKGYDMQQRLWRSLSAYYCHNYSTTPLSHYSTTPLSQFTPHRQLTYHPVLAHSHPLPQCPQTKTHTTHPPTSTPTPTPTPTRVSCSTPYQAAAEQDYSGAVPVLLQEPPAPSALLAPYVGIHTQTVGIHRDGPQPPPTSELSPVIPPFPPPHPHPHQAPAPPTP